MSKHHCVDASSSSSLSPFSSSSSSSPSSSFSSSFSSLSSSSSSSVRKYNLCHLPSVLVAHASSWLDTISHAKLSESCVFASHVCQLVHASPVEYQHMSRTSGIANRVLCYNGLKRIGLGDELGTTTNGDWSVTMQQVCNESRSASTITHLTCFNRHLLLPDHDTGVSLATLIRLEYLSIKYGRFEVQHEMPYLHILTRLRTLETMQFYMSNCVHLPRSITSLSTVWGSSIDPTTEWQNGWRSLLALPLTRLIMRSYLTASFLADLCTHLPNLDRFECSLVGLPSMVPLEPPHMKRLTHLGIHLTRAEYFPHMAQLIHLQSLYLDAPWENVDEVDTALRPLIALSQFTTLHVEGNTFEYLRCTTLSALSKLDTLIVSDRTSSQLGDIRALGKCARLTSLSFQYCKLSNANLVDMCTLSLRCLYINQMYDEYTGRRNEILDLNVLSTMSSLRLLHIFGMRFECEITRLPVHLNRLIMCCCHVSHATNDVSYPTKSDLSLLRIQFPSVTFEKHHDKRCYECITQCMM